MSLIKLKTGLNETSLGSLFGISQSQALRTVFTWFRFLGKVIGSLVLKPQKDAVLASRPKAFHDPPYRDVRHIIDATEVFIETPKSLEVAASCYSEYKHHHTAKFLISVNPNGHINYVSNAWEEG